MDYEAVFWDVGGVLVDVDSLALAQVEFVEAAVAEYDLAADTKSALEVWRDALREHFAGREGREYRTAREGRRKAAEALFDGDPPEGWRVRYQETAGEVLELNPGVEETLRTLHDAGVYQAVISDADAELGTRLEAFGLDQYLQHVTTSEEVGYVKPDGRMFETAFEKAREAGVDPEQGIMVGDKYDNDVEGGSAAGLTTVAFGAEDGPAVDYHVDEVADVLAIVGVGEDG